MNASNGLRRLRGALGNVLLWGLAWGVGALVVVTAKKLGHLYTMPVSWSDAVGIVSRFAIYGALASAAFSSFIAIRYRGRHLDDLSLSGFTMIGAVASAVIVPAMPTLSLLVVSGEFTMRYLGSPSWVLYGAAFGGIAAASTLKVAQRATLNDGSEVLQLSGVSVAAPPALGAQSRQ